VTASATKTGKKANSVFLKAKGKPPVPHRSWITRSRFERGQEDEKIKTEG